MRLLFNIFIGSEIWPVFGQGNIEITARVIEPVYCAAEVGYGLLLAVLDVVDNLTDFVRPVVLAVDPPVWGLGKSNWLNGKEVTGILRRDWRVARILGGTRGCRLLSGTARTPHG